MSVPLTFHWSKQVPQLHLILNYPHLSILLNAWKYNPLKEKQQIIGKNNITYMGVCKLLVGEFIFFDMVLGLIRCKVG